MAALQTSASLHSAFRSLTLSHGAKDSGFLAPSLGLARSVGATPSTLESRPAPGVVRMAIKRWEKKELKPNGLPVRQKLHVKIGDTVQVIAGKDKGKVSEVTRIFTHNSTVVLRDINIKTKHVKGKAEGEAGQIIQVEAPVHSSNVMLYSRAQKVASRIGHKLLEDGTKVRYLLKTGEVIDKPTEWKRSTRAKKSQGGSSESS